MTMVDRLTHGWTAFDLATLSAVLVVIAAILAALLFHGVWPKTEPTPTALIVFVSALLFRTAAGISMVAAAHGHLSVAAFDPASYAIRALFCGVLWVMLALLHLRQEKRLLVAHSRALCDEARATAAAIHEHNHGAQRDGDDADRDADGGADAARRQPAATTAGPIQPPDAG